MNKAITTYLASCEKDTSFRQGPLWPKIVHHPISRASAGQSIPWPIPMTAHFQFTQASHAPDAYSFE
jgi:hypothetical protein